MMAITTSNSTSVKARLRGRRVLILESLNDERTRKGRLHFRLGAGCIPVNIGLDRENHGTRTSQQPTVSVNRPLREKQAILRNSAQFLAMRLGLHPTLSPTATPPICRCKNLTKRR